MQRGRSNQPAYEVLSLLGRGTFGQVWLARHTGTGEQVAIKRIVKVDEKVVTREVEILEALRQRPFCVQLREVFFTEGAGKLHTNIVMAFCPDNLENMIAAQRAKRVPFAPSEVRKFAWQLFQGLATLHNGGVMHRDIKPENILLDSNGDLAISDFGCAKFFGEGVQSTPFMGSQYYRAPELLFGDTDYGPEVDIWSAACIVLELATLEPVFRGNEKSERLLPVVRLAGPVPPVILKRLGQEHAALKGWARWLKREQAEPPDSNWLAQVCRFFDSNGTAEDFFRRIFVFQTKKTRRMTVETALQHPFFAFSGRTPRRRLPRSSSAPLRN